MHHIQCKLAISCVDIGVALNNNLAAVRGQSITRSPAVSGGIVRLAHVKRAVFNRKITVVLNKNSNVVVRVLAVVGFIGSVLQCNGGTLQKLHTVGGGIG